MCVKDTPSPPLGNEAGVKSLARVRVREAQDLMPASLPKHNRACRAVAIGPAPAWSAAPPSSRSKSRPSRHVASCHINSYPVRCVWQRYQEPPCTGQQARRSGTILETSACCSQSWVRSRALDLGGADQARPKLVISQRMLRCPFISFRMTPADGPPGRHAIALSA